MNDEMILILVFILQTKKIDGFKDVVRIVFCFKYPTN